jgi:hypothetical protein
MTRLDPSVDATRAFNRKAIIYKDSAYYDFRGIASAD